MLRLTWMLLFVPILAVAQSANQVTALKSIVGRAHADGSFSGVVIVSRGGVVLFVEALGFADKAHHVPVTAKTLFRLASETKQVTAVLVMQEVSKGNLTLDAKAGDYLPGLALHVSRVTVRPLLQHVSGLTNPSDGPDDRVPPFYLRQDADAADNTKAAGWCGRGQCASAEATLCHHSHSRT